MFPHFRGQVKPNAAAHFSMEVKSFALQRMSGKSPNHAPALMAHVKQTAANGDELLNKHCFTSGIFLEGQSIHAPIADYASKPDLLRSHIKTLAADVARPCGELLQKKLEV